MENGEQSPPVTPVTACALRAASRIWASFSPAPAAPANLFSPARSPAPSPAAPLMSGATAAAAASTTSTAHSSVSEGMQNLINAEDITERDILIKDKCLAAAKGTTEHALESNTSRNESYYSKLIDTVARSMLTQPWTDKEWEKNTLLKASMAIVKSVQRTKGGRFIWVKQLCGSQYVVLSEDNAAHKISNDIRCQLAALEAQKVQENQDETQLQLLRRRLTYGKNLIKTVFTAEKSGLSPMEAAKTLDFPVIPDDWPFDQAYTEPEEFRRIRLQLRQRYLALARTHGPFHDFSMKMIAGWTESEALLKKRMQRKSKSKEVIAKAVNACAEMMNKEDGTAGTPRTFSRSDLPPSFSSGFFGSLNVENDNSVKHADAVGNKKANATKKKKSGKKKDKIEKRLWSLEERALMLEGIEQHAFGNWILISPSIPTRSNHQVASYGRYIRRKFKLPNDGFPDEACREYLLRPEGD